MSAECHPRDNGDSKSSLLRRISRSSSKIMLGMTPPVEKAPPDVVAQTTNASAAAVPANAKITALTKLKVQLGRRAKKSKLRLPPSSWNVEPASVSGVSGDTQESTLDESTQSTPDERTSVENPGSSPGHDSGQATVGDIVEPPPFSEMDNPTAEESSLMSAATLARRIHALLSSFPPFYALSSSGSFRLQKSSPDQGDNLQGAWGPLADSKLLALLSSATTMNGSIAKGRESVWSILERLRYAPDSKSENRETNKDEGGTSSSEGDVETSSVMICCPLEPTEDTEVELALSEVVSIDFENTETPTEPAQEPKFRGTNMWPFGKGKDKQDNPSPEPPRPPRRPKEVRVWFPSRTKVSLQAAWWGYRIYLPPPVMRVLSDKSLEAAKRAAIITAALTWLVSHIPTEMLPPQLRAVVGIVKGIVPIVGYVGGFIAWSWNTIQSFDKGQGVILSATWLLPIALVPGTWDYVPPSHSPVGGSESASIPPTPPPKDPRLSIRPAAPSPPTQDADS